jgi:hypothetical protein
MRYLPRVLGVLTAAYGVAIWAGLCALSARWADC